MAGDLIRPAKNQGRTHDARHADHHVRRRHRRKTDQATALSISRFLGAVIILGAKILSAMILGAMINGRLLLMHMHGTITMLMHLVSLHLHGLDTMMI